eukprot:3501125-Rhodomonas_salina.1
MSGLPAHVDPRDSDKVDAGSSVSDLSRQHDSVRDAVGNGRRTAQLDTDDDDDDDDDDEDKDRPSFQTERCIMMGLGNGETGSKDPPAGIAAREVERARSTSSDAKARTSTPHHRVRAAVAVPESKVGFPRGMVVCAAVASLTLRAVRY